MPGFDPSVLPREAIVELCRKRRVRELVIVGSAARGDAGAESDVDFVVRFDDTAAWSTLDLARFSLELEAVVGRAVDVVEERAVANPLVLAGLSRDRRVVYAA